MGISEKPYVVNLNMASYCHISPFFVLAFTSHIILDEKYIPVLKPFALYEFDV